MQNFCIDNCVMFYRSVILTEIEYLKFNLFSHFVEHVPILLCKDKTWHLKQNSMTSHEGRASIILFYFCSHCFHLFIILRWSSIQQSIITPIRKAIPPQLNGETSRICSPIFFTVMLYLGSHVLHLEPCVLHLESRVSITVFYHI